MLKTSRKSSLRNEKGMAIIETLPLLVLFIMLTGFGLGLFGVIHTATLHSIAARTYAFETFRNRTKLDYYREDGSGLDEPYFLGKKGYRYHAVQNEGDPRLEFVATTRALTYGRDLAEAKAPELVHNQGIFNMDKRNEKIAVNPVWIMVAYGICLNAQCGN
jgi:hypothetical protein